MVVMVMSRAHYLHDPTQQDFINTHNQEETQKMKCMLIFSEKRDSSMSFTSILPKTSHHTIHKV